MSAVQIRAMSFALCAAVLAALALSASASAAAAKPYSLVICALGSNETCAPSPTSTANQPAGVPVGTSGVAMTATFTNQKTATSKTLGSANLTPPAGFTATSATIANCPRCATVVGNVVQLRNLALAPGSSLTVSLSVNTPATGCTVASPCAWSSVAKQAGNFTGSAGDILTLDTTTSTLKTVLANLQFSSQPHNVALGQVITDTDYTPPPAGGPVIVTAADATGAVVSSYNGPVSLTLNTPNNPSTNPTPSTLGGTTSTNAVGGVAKFANLTVSAAGNGYTLTAASPPLPPSATSATFNAQQSGTPCAAGTTCQVQMTSANSTTMAGGVDATVAATSGPTATMGGSIDFGVHMPADQCEGYRADHDVYWNLTGTTARNFTVSITTTVLSGIVTEAMINGQDNCLAAPKEFTEINERVSPPMLAPAPPATQPDGTPGFSGLLPDCGTGEDQVDPATNPCVTSRTGTSNPLGGGTLTITITVPGPLGDMTSRG